MRRLIYIPIIHTPADMGSLQEAIRDRIVQDIGIAEWRRNVQAIERLWELIRNTVDRLNLFYPEVRLYQDGLPYCGREEEIVRELANAGSANHRLLVHLMDKGAELMGTESADLLLDEYQLIRQVVAAQPGEQMRQIEERQHRASRSVLEKRDRYIGQRINTTLASDQTGILFLGMLHSVEPYLAPDIQVSYPVTRPRSQRESGSQDDSGETGSCS
jgi:hypothetical protein